MNEFNFEHPRDIGSSEYRAIYGCLETGLEDCPAEERAELAEAMLAEFIGHAKAMLQRISEQSAHTDDGLEPPSALPAEGIPADAVRDIVAAIREYMFLKNGRWQWQDLSGADFIEFVTGLLSEHGLIPAECDG